MAKLLKLRKKEVPYEEIQAPCGTTGFLPREPSHLLPIRRVWRPDPGEYPSEAGGHGPRQRTPFSNRQGRPGERGPVLYTGFARVGTAWPVRVPGVGREQPACRPADEQEGLTASAACGLQCSRLFRLQRAGNREPDFYIVGWIPHNRQDGLAQLRERGVHIPAVQEPRGAN